MISWCKPGKKLLSSRDDRLICDENSLNSRTITGTSSSCFFSNSERCVRKKSSRMRAEYWNDSKFFTNSWKNSTKMGYCLVFA